VFARSAVLWIHLAGVVVWFGAVAYFLFILRPAVRSSQMERKQWYLLLRRIKDRLRLVVGIALLAIVSSGALLADWRGLLRTDLWSGAGLPGRVFLLKLLVVLLLVALYLAALPIISRLEPPVRRGRAFVQVHVAALLLGSVAAFLGLLIHG
jgi:uncharacterized membrane protein